MFELSKEYEFEATGDERPNVVISDPAPKCALATRKDTGDWFVATGVYFKPIESLDGTTFRDIDGGIWRLLVTNKSPSPQPRAAGSLTKEGEQ